MGKTSKHYLPSGKEYKGAKHSASSKVLKHNNLKKQVNNGN